MTEMRQNPLPAGRYWVFVSKPHSAAFETWRAINKDSVHVEVTEATEPAFFIFTVAESVKVPGGTSTITIPVQWDANTFGFPSVAGPEVKSSSDVTQAPDLPKDPTDQLSDTLDGIGSLGKALGVGVAAVLGAYLIGKFLEGRKGKAT